MSKTMKKVAVGNMGEEELERTQRMVLTREDTRAEADLLFGAPAADMRKADRGLLNKLFVQAPASVTMAPNLQKMSSAPYSFMKVAYEIKPSDRPDIPKKQFAQPNKEEAGHKGKYPIPDAQHYRSALGFAKMHGDTKAYAAIKAKGKAMGYGDGEKEKKSFARHPDFDVDADARDQATRAMMMKTGPGRVMQKGLDHPALVGAVGGAGFGALTGRTLASTALGGAAGAAGSYLGSKAGKLLAKHVSLPEKHWHPEYKAAYTDAVKKITKEKKSSVEMLKLASVLACGPDGGDSWLKQFEGTDFLPQAIELEEQALMMEREEQEQRAEDDIRYATQDQARKAMWAKRDELNFQKRMLALQLAKHMAGMDAGAHEEMAPEQAHPEMAQEPAQPAPEAPVQAPAEMSKTSHVDAFFEKLAAPTDAQRRYPELLKAASDTRKVPNLKPRVTTDTSGATPTQSSLKGGSA